MTLTELMNETSQISKNIHNRCSAIDQIGLAMSTLGMDTGADLFRYAEQLRDYADELNVNIGKHIDRNFEDARKSEIDNINSIARETSQ